MGITTTILLVVQEEPDQDFDDQSSVLETYHNVICVSCLPAVRTLLICLITCKVIVTSRAVLRGILGATPPRPFSQTSGLSLSPSEIFGEYNWTFGMKI